MLQRWRIFGASIALGMLLLVAFAIAAFADTPQPTNPVAATPTVTTSQVTTLTILGQVTNGTPGGTLPVTMTVTLFAIDGQTPAFTTQGTSDALGKVRFENVAYQPGRAYALAAIVGTDQYHSDLLAPKAGDSILTLPLRIYDTTTDASQLRVDEMFVVAQFSSDKELQIINAYVLSNAGDRTVEGGEKTPNGQPGTLRFYLPPGAGNVEFQGDDGKKFQRTQDGYIARVGVTPGANTAQIAMRYTLPYTGQLHLETKTQYPVQKVSVLLPTEGITLTSASLIDQGIQTEPDGIPRRTYAQNGLTAGQALAFDLSGTRKVPAASPTQGTTTGATSPVGAPAKPAPLEQPVERRLVGEGIVIVGLLAILVACGWQLVRLRRPATTDAAGEHSVLFEALADLDEEHEAGKIADADYAEQREFLKATLLAALQSTSSAGKVASEGQA